MKTAFKLKQAVHQLNFLPPFNVPCVVLPYKVQTGKFVERVLQVLLSQMSSCGYWPAVSISKGFHLGWISACIFTHSLSHPPAHRRQKIFGVYYLIFWSHNTHDLLKNVLTVSSLWRDGMLREALLVQFCHIQRQRLFAFAIRRSWQCECLTDNDMKASVEEEARCIAGNVRWVSPVSDLETNLDMHNFSFEVIHLRNNSNKPLFI